MELGRSVRTAVMLGIGVFALVIGITACGGSSSGSSSGTTEGSSKGEGKTGGGSTGAVVKKAEEEIAGATSAKDLEWPKPPTKPYNPGTGKIAIISSGQAGINVREASKAATEAAKAMGWTPSPTFDGEFSSAKQAEYVEQAVQEGYNAIFLAVIEPDDIKGAIDHAYEAGVTVVCIDCGTDDEGKAIVISPNAKRGGELLANWAIIHTEGKASGILFEDKSTPITVQNLEAQLETFENCSTCGSFKKVSVPTTEIEKPTPPTVDAELEANPPGSGLNILSAPYDPLAIGMVKSLEQQARTEEITIMGIDASPESVSSEFQCGCMGATTGTPFGYMSWAAVDIAARTKVGAPMWEANGMPSVLITKENASEYEHEFFQPEFEYKEMFEKTWGK